MLLHHKQDSTNTYLSLTTTITATPLTNGPVPLHIAAFVKGSAR